MTDECEPIKLVYGMKVQTNATYSKKYRTQRPFIGTITHAVDGRGEVKVLKDSGNTISIPQECLTPRAMK